MQFNKFMKNKLVLIAPLLLIALLVTIRPILADEPDVVTDVAVSTGTIIQTDLHRYVLGYGMVEPAPASHGQAAASAKIAAPVTGIITKVNYEEGQTVTKGSMLFSLNSQVADAALAKATVAATFAQKNLARKQQLNPGETISQKLLDEAEQLVQLAQADLKTAQAQRELLTITASLSGTLSAIHVRVGESVNPNTVLADLIDLQRLIIALPIPSHEASALRLGQVANIDIGDSTRPQLGKVSYLSPQIDPLTDTRLIHIIPQDADCLAQQCLRPGQSVNIRIAVETLPNQLVVPIESVVITDKTATIALVEGEFAKRHAVTVGLRENNWLGISGEGLQAGMTIVTQGAYGLLPETRIRVVK